MGDFSIDFLGTFPLEKYKSLFREQKYHRFNDKCAEDFYFAVQKIREDYGGDATGIWSDNPSSGQLVSRFLEFKGVGPSIANMAANILARGFKIEMSDYSSIDISTDRHIVRVMSRLYFGYDAKEEDVIEKAREINPEFPGMIDILCRVIGKQYCHTKNPECHNCPLLRECMHNLGH